MAGRFEILGVFGSGKTTIAKLLSESNSLTLRLEDHTLNPYWGQNKLLEAGGHLAYDMSFLIQHLHLVQSKTFLDPDHAMVCDWSFQTDSLWASLRLSPEQLSIYRGALEIFMRSIPPPRGFIYLAVDPDEIYERMQKRGRPPELPIARRSVIIAHEKLRHKVASLPDNKVLVVRGDASKKDICEFISEKSR